MLDIRRHPIMSALTLIIVCLASWVAPGAPRETHAGQGKPEVSSIRFYSQAELRGVHQSVFETLFLQPWEENHWEYPLDAEVVGGRGVYTGKNQYGQIFELDIKVFAQVDMRLVALEPRLRTWADANAFTVAGAIGELRHGDSRVRVHGKVISSRMADGGSSYRFWLSNIVPSDSAIFDSRLPAPPLTEVPPPRSVVRDAERGLGGGGSCLSECARIKNNAIRSAGQTYDNTVAAAVVQRNIAIQAAHQTYQAAYTQADNTLTNALLAATAGETACLIACAASGPATLPCVLGCGAAYVIAIALANANYATDVAAAKEARDIAINAADQSFNATLNSAETAYGQAVDAANQAAAQCRAGCPDENGGPGPIQEPE